MLKCVIIDDEPYAIDILVRYMEHLPKLVVKNVFVQPLDALELIGNQDPIDIIFMDVDMPGISGIELAKLLRYKTEKLIFTTAYSEYGYKAFEVDGDAFLLKPYTLTRFLQVINKLFPPKEITKTNLVESSDYFLVKNSEDDLKIVKVKYNDVVAFESFQNHIKIHLSGHRTVVAYLTMKDVAQFIKDHPEFLQIHRAFIISTHFIDHIQGNVIKMLNSLTFTIGESFKENFHLYIADKLFKTSRKN